MFIFGSILLILISAIRFTVEKNKTVHDFVVNSCYLTVGVITGMSQMQYRSFNYNFRFLSYHWGKLLMCLFLASVSIGTLDKDKEGIETVEWLVTVYFLLSAIPWALLTVKDRQRDLE